MKPGFLMKPAHATALLVAASALLLSACDIPATGVVEAGGPASGIPPTVPIYLVRDGALVAVPRTISDAGEPVTAVESLLKGPTPQERRKRLTTELARQLPVTTRPTPSPAEPSPEESVRLMTETDGLYLELPRYAGKMTTLAANQVICTAARAYLLTRPDLDSTTVTVTDAAGGTFEGDVERCPEL
ncbi:hypothetical protein OG864_20690 [Streptomyces sp. NBC_00124]|uniref:hypothetical protein n=1 Tax=Streptomyces sp. NBC_00124 TaxID=2975662 RepID=UPI0022567ABE|nr:hypothetical protein [Streptomyces sp. NBC_00124]MCX5361128.1 hypothetical protein [Streptomyces sp. NBC_00124]